MHYDGRVDARTGQWRQRNDDARGGHRAPEFARQPGRWLDELRPRHASGAKTPQYENRYAAQMSHAQTKASDDPGSNHKPFVEIVQAAMVAQTICRIDVGDGEEGRCGVGFLLDGNRILTAAHAVRSFRDDSKPYERP
jgi:hypothetical protein